MQSGWYTSSERIRKTPQKALKKLKSWVEGPR